MNKEEIDLLEIVFTLAIGECAYNDINDIQKLGYKIKTINKTIDKLRLKHNTQQKEFINYLEKEIKRINPNDLYISELNLRLDDIKFTQYLIYKETLQKYKEITGVSDDKTN